MSFAAEIRREVVTNRAPDCGVHLGSVPESIVRDIGVRKRSHDLRQPGRERPRNDPGVRVGGPEAGSLTSRLLSAASCASAEIAAASSIEPPDSLSVNSHSVFAYGHRPRLTSGRDRDRAPIGTRPRRGEMDALA